jgi:isoquinoline 1-oxidoreductase subunit beta
MAFHPRSAETGFSRRNVLISLAAAGGLAVGWSLWPREYPHNLVAAEGETILNAWLKIGRDGRVTIVVPQVEMGQGSYTLIAQIIADELGADWRTIGVEPAPLNPAYNNPLYAEETQEGMFADTVMQVTGGSSTIRAFEMPARRAAAAARVLLCMAAAAQIDASWEACDTEAGFVVRGPDRLRFGELAEAAAGFSLPDVVPLRSGQRDRLVGHGVSRLDVPAKLDGSANYAGDIRLRDMVFAAIRQGPIGDSRLIRFDKRAAGKVMGMLQIVNHERWLAAIATNWWAANHALNLMNPTFHTEGEFASDKRVEQALDYAMKGDPNRIMESGDVDTLLASGRVLKADYNVGFAPHAALEPLAATASIDDGKLQLWIATQVPGLARKAAARAVGIDEDKVTVHTTQIGGSFGRKYEVEIAAQVAILTEKIGRPVQLMWSRAEDFRHDPFRPAAHARMSARMEAAGRVDAWLATIAVPDAIGEMEARTVQGLSAFKAQQSVVGNKSLRSVAGAVPPYGIANVAVEQCPADLGVPTGKWRSGAHSYTAFFNESFIDELSHASGVEPFSFRMAMLGGNPRLALCLSKAVAKGGWQGGAQGTSQGIACHMMLGSYVAVLAEARMGDDQRVKVTKLICVADVGRVINPDIARQQIEGGLMFGLAAATGNSVTINRGIAGPLRLRDLGLPRLADMPEINVELIRSHEPPGGVGEVAVPPVAPAIANALFAGSGQRFRSLPLAPENNP